MSTLDFSRPRIAEFSRRITSELPCNPDTDDVRADLASLSFRDRLLASINWRDRHIPPRARQVFYVPDFWTGRALRHGGAVIELERKIREGSDLSSHLSKKALTHGYSPTSFREDGRRIGSKYVDKDLGLNAFGAHHLHLGQMRNNREMSHRTDDLLFVYFARDYALVLLLGDHKSFFDGTLSDASTKADVILGRKIEGIRPPLTPTTGRDRSLLALYGFGAFAYVDGAVTMGSTTSSSGHSIFSVRHADQIIDALNLIEPKLEDRTYVNWLSGTGANRLRDEIRMSWYLHYSDLVLVEENAGIAMTIVKGRA